MVSLKVFHLNNSRIWWFTQLLKKGIWICGLKYVVYYLIEVLQVASNLLKENIIHKIIKENGQNNNNKN